MRVLVYDNHDCEESQEVLAAYQVNNVACLFLGQLSGFSVIMEIIGQEDRLIQVSVSNQEEGDAMVRKLVKEGYLDLTDIDVYIGELG